MAIDELMTPDEVQHLLRVTRQAMLRMRKSGVLRPVQLSSRVFRYRRSEVEALIQKEAS